MKLKTILSVIIILSLAYAVVLPSSWNFCLPDGCVFASVSGCSMSSCFNEDVLSHINERAVFFNIILLDNVNFLFFLAAAVFLLRKALNEFFNASQLAKYKAHKNRDTLLNNLFIILFSKGVLHPKNF